MITRPDNQLIRTARRRLDALRAVKGIALACAVGVLLYGCAAVFFLGRP
jgi:hypothetical protein